MSADKCGLTKKQMYFIQNLELEREKARKNHDYTAYKQMLLRVKEKAANSIKVLLWLEENLPNDKLQKILTDDRINNLFGITEKALEITEWKYDGSTILLPDILKEKYVSTHRKKALGSHLNKLLSRYFSEAEYKAHKSLLEKYTSPVKVESEIVRLKIKVGEYVSENEQLKEFIKERDLLEQYENRKKMDIEKRYKPLFEKEGFTEEQIKKLLRTITEQHM